MVGGEARAALAALAAVCGAPRANIDRLTSELSHFMEKPRENPLMVPPSISSASATARSMPLLHRRPSWSHLRRGA